MIYEISNLRNKGKNMNQNPLRLINEITMQYLLNDKITIIVNLQYRKGFLYWCWKEKEWKYYFILSHLM